MAQTPQRTRLQDFIVTQTGDAVRGEDGNQGQSVLIRGGHSSVDLNAGGQIGIQGGNPGASGIGGAIGIQATAGATGITDSAGGAGGPLLVAAGAGGQGGALGSVPGTAGGLAGTILISAGAGGAGVGTGVGQAGGGVFFASGAGGTGATPTAGGNIILQTAAGPGVTHSGGSILLYPAPAVGAGTDGTVQISSNVLGSHGLVLDEWPVAPYDPTGQNRGTFWVQTGTPNLPYFTDDLGAPHNLLAAAAGVPTYDSYLDQGAGGDADPIFTDMVPIAAKIAGLPALSVGYPVTNTLHFLPGTDLTLVTPGAYLLTNTELRGTAPIGGPIAFDAASVLVPGDGAVVFGDIRTFRDLNFLHSGVATTPTFQFPSSPYCEFDNVSVTTPTNGSPAFGIWNSLERLRINKTYLNSSSFTVVTTMEVEVETDNFIKPEAFLGAGNVTLFLKGSGNQVSILQSATLDIDVGDGLGLAAWRFSGADSITFGAGETSWAWSGPPIATGFQLRPGGGMFGDPAAPVDTVGYLVSAGRAVSGIARGIHVQVGTATVDETFDVWVLEGGVPIYVETGFTISGCVGFGAYLSTTFGEITGGALGPALAVWIVPAATSAGHWDHINVTVFVK